MRFRWRWTPRPMSCHEVQAVIQAFLDDETDEVAARRVADHLHDCVRCGMEAATYEDIKRSVRRSGPPLDPESIARLRTFGEQLAAGELDQDGTAPGWG